MKFGLMFFAASEDSLGPDKYRLVLDSARFADQAGFSSVWVPERHFTGFGGLYPNPAVLHAGLATCTSRIRLNAGSVVAPLHHPVRIAEEWAVVDNLSNGRVGLSFASGWNPNDFVLSPDQYADRHEHLMEAMQVVQGLWRGEAFEGTNGVGQSVSVKTFPRPVQPELPVWLTVAGNPRNFERAGTCGAHLLTHLLDQDEAGLAARIALYRNAREAAGFDPETGIVSLMIHTLVGADAELVREQARLPYCNYIKANIGLFKGLEQSRGRDVDLSTMSESDLDEFVNFLYDRFAAARGLIGTPESCAPLVARLEAIGVSELACLLDFGPHVDLILENLPHLNRLKALHTAAATAVVTRRPPTGKFDRAEVLARCSQELTGDQFHRVLGDHGIHVDGAFRPITTIWRRDGEALAQMSLGASDAAYQVHPASLDACGRILAAALPRFDREGSASYVPTGFDACDVLAPLAGTVWVHAAIGEAPSASTPLVRGDVNVYDESGRTLVQLAGLSLSLVEGDATRADAGDRLAQQLVYERTWRVAPAPAPKSDPRDAAGKWLVISGGTDSGVVAAELVQQIELSGGQCVTVPEPELRGRVYLGGLDATTPSDVEQVVQDVLRLAQPDSQSPVWIVTRGAVTLVQSRSTVTASGVSQAPLWGFGRAWAVERPGALGGLVDLDPTRPAVEFVAQLLDVLTGDRDEDMVALRSGERYVPRLIRGTPIPHSLESTEADSVPLVFEADATVVVTGGTGGLGLRLTEWLVSRGAMHILLSSRRAPGQEAQALLSRLRSSGVDVKALQVDVADSESLSATLQAAVSAGTPISSVFHLAGVLDDGRLEDQTQDRFSAVLAPKIAGAWNLHQFTAETPLKHFVLFSSVSSLMPAPGQASYAAANAFLDGLAHYRRSLGLVALAVNWGPWSDAGHAETDYGREAHTRLASMGIGAIRPAVGFRVLEGLLRADSTQAAVASVNWAQLVKVDPTAARFRLLADLVKVTDAPQGQVHAPSALVERLAALTGEERRPFLLQYLSDTVIAALKLRIEGTLDPRQRLFDLGLDSIMALELKNRLSLALGVTLSATLLFVHPTLDALCDHILNTVVVDTPSAAASFTPAATTSELSEEELTRRLLEEIEISRGT